MKIARFSNNNIEYVSLSGWVANAHILQPNRSEFVREREREREERACIVDMLQMFRIQVATIRLIDLYSIENALFHFVHSNRTCVFTFLCACVCLFVNLLFFPMVCCTLNRTYKQPTCEKPLDPIYRSERYINRQSQNEYILCVLAIMFSVGF